MGKTTKKWDRHSIKAEIHRRGMTLTGIARDAGLAPSSTGHGLIGASRPGAEAIAAALGMDFRELFPHSYTRGRHDEERQKREQARAKASQTADAA